MVKTTSDYLASLAEPLWRICLAYENFVATRLPLHHPRAYAIRPYKEIRTLRPLRDLREIFRVLVAPR